ncbi:ComEC/Rec2 family competence protein [Pontibacillus litoralis]|uniref:Hydrolase n=1 Tax=Pontibacillus litoralis JSM 072002 TaxID=1385512 RepID=A0A0A5G4J7_9BACI|nr:hypothetical protein [Pontibacillus litoralis]KGX88026.1 hypothetical protein N784_12635 [Pontibacillus litoralis JSM 072002]
MKVGCVVKRYFLYAISLAILMHGLFIKQTIAAPPSLSIGEEEVLFTFLEMPDGEAMLIQTGFNQSILVNTGAKQSKQQLTQQLNQLGVQKLNGLIITSSSDKECGNVQDVMEQYEVSNVYYTGHISSRCMEQMNREQLKNWKKNHIYELSPQLFIKVITSSTNGSMSLYMQYGQTSLLFLANGDEALEDKLREASPIQADIVKLADYAVTSLPSMELLNRIDPHMAMIYPLKGKTPNETLLERLEESWVDVYQLDKIGTMTIHCTMEDYELFPK